MREDLIAYALGELDTEQQRRIEQALAENEALRDELQQIERCLGDIDCDEPADDDVPIGLADRTTAGIFSGCWNGRESAKQSSSSLGFSAVSCIMSPVDMVVAIGVLITIGSLLAPALYNTRNQSQRISCANNLRQLGELITLYSERYDGYFPLVRPNEHVGIFASRLREADFVRSDLLDQAMICPGSPLAEQLAEQGRRFHVPSMAELSLATGMLREELQRTTSGSYGYQVGYLNQGYYVPASNHSNSLVPVIADAPSRLANHRASANHDGNGINALMQDGSVLTLSSPRLPCSNDFLFLNAAGEPAPGNQWNDGVILSSGEKLDSNLELAPRVRYRVWIFSR